MFGKAGYQSLQGLQNSLGALNNMIENISNVNSIGYKQKKSSFVETLNGEMARHENKDFSQGPLRRTGELYDLALEGPGFFEVELPNGQRAFTRAGRFNLTGDGELVTTEGYRVIPEIEQQGKSVIEVNNNQGNELGLNMKVATAKITIPHDLTPEISQDGTVSGISGTSGEKTKIGKINIVVFNNPQGMESIGRGYFLQTKNSGAGIETNVGPDGTTKIKQGFLEYGNVNMANEFMNMSQIRNLMSAQFKVLKTLDKIYENIHYTISRSA